MGRRTLKSPDSGGAQGSTLQKDEIVQDIIDKMVSGTWRNAIGRRELCRKHDLGPDSAERYVAEASRVLRLGYGSEEMKAAILSRIDAIGRAAELRTEEAITPTGEVVSLSKPDMRTALDACKQLSNITGLTGPSSEVVIRFQQMSNNELWQHANELLSGKTEHASLIETTADDSDDDSDRAALDRLVPVNPRRG